VYTFESGGNFRRLPRGINEAMQTLRARDADIETTFVVDERVGNKHDITVVISSTVSTAAQMKECFRRHVSSTHIASGYVSF
jgi:hypothetical protein